MMNVTGYFEYYENDDVKILEMASNYTDYCVGFILPSKWDNSSILTKIGNWISDLNKLFKVKHKVVVHIPKFTQEFSINLNKIFPTIDWETYDELHKSTVIIDEKGAEVAAKIISKSIRNDTKEEHAEHVNEVKIFNANKPFSYYVRYKWSEEMDTLLLIGNYCGTEC